MILLIWILTQSIAIYFMGWELYLALYTNTSVIKQEKWFDISITVYYSAPHLIFTVFTHTYLYFTVILQLYSWIFNT